LILVRISSTAATSASCQDHGLDAMQQRAGLRRAAELDVRPGEGEHQQHSRQDEQPAGQQQSDRTGARVLQVDGKLRRGQARYQVARTEQVEERLL
jgi:hypothetical protein